MAKAEWTELALAQSARPSVSTCEPRIRGTTVAGVEGDVAPAKRDDPAWIAGGEGGAGSGSIIVEDWKWVEAETAGGTRFAGDDVSRSSSTTLRRPTSSCS